MNIDKDIFDLYNEALSRRENSVDAILKMDLYHGFFNFDVGGKPFHREVQQSTGAPWYVTKEEMEEFERRREKRVTSLATAEIKAFGGREPMPGKEIIWGLRAPKGLHVILEFTQFQSNKVEHRFIGHGEETQAEDPEASESNWWFKIENFTGGDEGFDTYEAVKEFASKYFDMSSRAAIRGGLKRL